MSRDFEQEYREMMNSQIPDLWERIEQGVNASERANKVISLEEGAKERKVQIEYSEPVKKKPVNLYQLYAFAGAVACMALVMVGMPTVKRNMIAEQQAEEAGRAYVEEQKTKTSSSEQAEDEQEAVKTFVHTKSMDVSESTKSVSKTENKSDDTSSSENTEKVPVKSSSYPEVIEKAEEAVYTENTEQIFEADDQTEDKTEKKKKSKSISVQVEKPEDMSSTAAVAASSAIADDVVKESSEPVESEAGKQDAVSNKGATSSDKPAEADKNETAEQQETIVNIAETTETEEIESTEIKTVAVTGAEEPVAGEAVEETECYQGIKVKVTAVSKSKTDGKVTYTVKVLEDPSKTFKKNKKLKMVSETELKKNSKYVIDFSYSGECTKKNVKIYKTVAVSDIEE